MSDSAREALQRLAALANQLHEEERAELLSALGEYTHDLKHMLGLVTGANALISRTGTGQEQIEEMTKIIMNASSQLDEYITLMVEELNNRIDNGD